jgi:RHH-type transcriptional regulator, rel operon repressor / antitoxin RelB
MKAQKNLGTRTMTLRLDAATLRRLDRLAAATDRSKAWLAAQAVKNFLDLNEWQTEAINQALTRANSPDAKFIDHEQVDAWLATWGKPDEAKPPQ